LPLQEAAEAGVRTATKGLVECGNVLIGNNIDSCATKPTNNDQLLLNLSKYEMSLKASSGGDSNIENIDNNTNKKRRRSSLNALEAATAATTSILAMQTPHSRPLPIQTFNKRKEQQLAQPGRSITNASLSRTARSFNGSMTSHTNTTIATTATTKGKLSVNQISHYVTIIILGFYFILSTIPYAITLSLQNNLTLRLNYHLPTQHAYLADPLWVAYGQYREWVIIFRLAFVSNHCLNFFFYMLFNPLFRATFVQIFVLNLIRMFKNRWCF
jgi:hypothetical protein